MPQHRIVDTVGHNLLDLLLPTTVLQKNTAHLAKVEKKQDCMKRLKMKNPHQNTIVQSTLTISSYVLEASENNQVKIQICVNYIFGILFYSSTKLFPRGRALLEVLNKISLPYHFNFSYLRTGSRWRSCFLAYGFSSTYTLSITHPVKNLLKTSEASLNFYAYYPYNF